MKMKCAVLLALAFVFSVFAGAGEPVEKAEMITPLLVGMNAPNVTLKNPDGSDFVLNEAVAGKPTVLVFYRGSW